MGLCVLAASWPGQASAQQAWLADWASQKNDEIAAGPVPGDDGHEYVMPTAMELSRRAARTLTEAETARNAATIELYKATIGANSPSSLLWSGLESGNPLTKRETYRWDSLRDQGLFDPETRAAVVTELQNVGIANLRIGLSNHEIDLDRPKSWADHDALVDEFASGGVNLSLDMHHFGVEDRFRTRDARGKTIPEKSYYLHSDWPDYFARFSGEAFARYGDRLKAVTLINEPETTVGFNSEMWHGAFPGWGDPRHGEVYIERAFAIASGAVKARMEIETVKRRTGLRPFFMHTEAAVHKPGRPDFYRIVRFLPSDLILGKAWLMDADIAELAEADLGVLERQARRKDQARRGPLQWLAETYVFSTDDETIQSERREKLVKLIGDLRDLHLALKRKHGVEMRDDTVFAVDYYAHNEDRGASGAWLNPEPQLYATQAAAAERRGLYAMILDYHDRYGLPVMIGETGTPYYAYGARWHAQMLLECAAAMEDGVPMLGYTIYPLVDTFGWETALSVPKPMTQVNPGGIMSHAVEARPFMRVLMQSLNNQTAQNAKAETTELVQ